MWWAFPGFLLGFLGSLVAAGPASGVIFYQALHGQFKKAKSLALGASLAEAIYCLVAFVSLVAVSYYLETYARPLQALASLLLLAVGWMFLKKKPSLVESKQVLSFSKYKMAHAVFTGFLLVALNPTLILTWGIVLAVLKAYFSWKMSWVTFIAFSLGVGLGALSWFLVAIAFLKKHHGKIKENFLHRLFLLLGIFFLSLGLVSLYSLAKTFVN